MLDMGDFLGGLVKYLRRHPVPRLTIGGGIGKITKLSQGAVDLHSSRSQVDFDKLAELTSEARLRSMRTALEAYELIGHSLAEKVATNALTEVNRQIGDVAIRADIVIIDRGGTIIGRAG